MVFSLKTGFTIRFASLFLCVFTLSLFALPVQARPQTLIPNLTHVIVISLDGARPDAILQMDTPNIQGFAARGAFTWNAQTVLPAATIPAHASMLTGLDVSEHGINWNDYSFDTTPIPTFLLSASEAGYRTAMVVGKEKFDQFLQSDSIDYTFARVGDRSVVDRTLELISDGYEVIFVHFPNPDYFGHSKGWMSEAYLYEMQNTDTQFGRILTALEENGLTDETLVILNADHGGHEFEHGGNNPEDRTIPWMIAGPGVIPGMSLENEVYVTDTASTVLWALGLPVPESQIARPISEAFGMTEDSLS